MNQVDSQRWFKENAPEFGGQISFDEPLSKFTYYKIGGPASVLAVPKSIEDLEWLRRGIQATRIPYFILGAGSNLLVSDQGFQGLVIRLNRLNLEISPCPAQVEASDAGKSEVLRVRTGASVMISMLLRRAAEQGWGGLEFLTGVPGSIGGAVFMNAGTHLGETKDRLRHVEYFSLLDRADSADLQSSLKSFGLKDLSYEYRKNLFLPEGAVVWAAEWEVKKQDPSQVKTLIDETLSRRKSTQPIDFPSCGSVFKNPKEHGKSAWQVVDALGLRGHRIGDAQFAEKHSNFILNLGSAKAADVRALIELAKTRAQSELGIPLHEEVIYLGDFRK